MRTWKERALHVLGAVLLMFALPCALTLLLNSKMDGIYRAIRQQVQYIQVQTATGTTEMSLEEYVIGVTAADMPVEYEPEAIKAQMVLVRTNLYRKLEDEEAWDDPYVTLAELELQGVGEKFRKAQKETDGQILTWEGEPVMASYHALSAGATREASEVFQSDEYPYLRSKKCPADKESEEYSATIQIDDSWRELEILERDSAGYVLRLQLGDTVLSGEEFRNALGLASSNFQLEVNGGGVYVTTSGLGHGLGMSQYTAQQLALSGKTWREILSYFFEGTTLEQAG